MHYLEYSQMHYKYNSYRLVCRHNYLIVIKSVLPENLNRFHKFINSIETGRSVNALTI